MIERIEQLRRFQKCLRRAVEASTPGEAEAAEAAARRLMSLYKIDPVKLIDKSLYDCTTFADNALLLKLREERRASRVRKPPAGYMGDVNRVMRRTLKRAKDIR